MVRAGADKITVNTAAVLRPALISRIVARNLARKPSFWRLTPSAPAITGDVMIQTGGRESTSRDAVSSGLRLEQRTAPAKSSSPRWIATARKSVSTCPSPRRYPEAVTGAGDCLRWSAMAATFRGDFLRRGSRRRFGSLNFS